MKNKGKPKMDRGAAPAIEPLSFSEAELFGPLYLHPDSNLFLRRFTSEELKARLVKADILPALEQKGFGPVRLSTECVPPEEYRLYIFDEASSPAMKLVEVRLAFSRLDLSSLSNASALGSYEMLSIHWTLLQNPSARFSSQRPQLPGQDYPGLRLGRKFQDFLVALAKELHLHGLENHPQYYHNAVFYLDTYYFVDPQRQGVLRAMIRDLSKYPISVVSHAIEEGKLIEARTGQRWEWRAGAMVCPLSSSLGDYFSSPQYRGGTERSESAHLFDLAV